MPGFEKAWAMTPAAYHSDECPLHTVEGRVSRPAEVSTNDIARSFLSS